MPNPSSPVDTVRALQAQFLIGNAVAAAALLGVPPGGSVAGGPASVPGQGPGAPGLPVPEPIVVPVAAPEGPAAGTPPAGPAAAGTLPAAAGAR
ncbi:MAG: hypothetical protein J2P15_18535, partial [Micromonosporaceae bacterium]|nr:hypothetical protein [Micromonosporaceae bacterium]